MTITHEAVEHVKSTTDAGMGILGVTVVLGWVNIVVGLSVILWYLLRFYEYLHTRSKEKTERAFYVSELKKFYNDSEEDFSVIHITELRRLYSGIRKGRGD